MNQESWYMNEREIFIRALETESPEKQAAFLEDACAGDLSLRQRVEALLRSHDKGNSLLERPPVPVPGITLDYPITERPGSRIGPYKLLQQIGEGGMGVVYMAEQKEPVKRRVALKIIKPGMDTQQVIARFEAERQALALMDHPNIAKVLDAGATESGRPYFVMELVNGIPITKYCDEQRLSPKERLELFVPICQAVQHAHQKGIIHRDLKPSNVLVAIYDGQAVPKVIDFGVAKATNQTLTEKTIFTELGQVVGTLEYMSPEQAERNQLDVDTRSDIYSLGVLLYELLTGSTPLDRERLRSAGFDEMLKMIREEEPVKPSTRASGKEKLPSVAAARNIDARKLASTIRGELDWIVMKALEKQRSRRYATANDFSADIERYLNHEPIEAGPPSRLYRFRKFARRNKAVLATVLCIVVSLVAGISIATWQMSIAIEQRDLAIDAKRESAARLRAEQAATKRATQAEAQSKRDARIADALNSFLKNDLLAARDSSLQRIRNLTLDELLDRAAATLANGYIREPEVEATVRNTLGASFSARGQLDKAELHLTRALELSKRHLGPNHQLTLRFGSDCAELFIQQGKYREGVELHRNILESRRRTLGHEHRETIQSISKLAFHLRRTGQLKASLDYHKESLQLAERVLGKIDPITINCRYGLASILSAHGDYNASAKLHRQALEEAIRCYGEKHAKVVDYTSGLASALRHAGEAKESERLMRRAIELSEELYGKTPSHFLNNLATAVIQQRRFEEGESLLRRALKAQTERFGERNIITLNTANNLGLCLSELKKYEESEKVLRRTLEVRREHLGQTHPHTLLSYHNLTVPIEAQHRLEDAENLLREAWQRVENSDAKRTPIRRSILTSLLRVLKKQEKFEAAEDLLNRLLEAKTKPQDESEREATIRYLCGVYSAWSWVLATAPKAGKESAESAADIARKGIALAPKSTYWKANLHNNLGVALFRCGRFEESRSALLAANEILEGADRAHRPFLAMCYWKLGEKELARKCRDEYLTWFKEKDRGKEAQGFLKEMTNALSDTSDSRQGPNK